MKIKNKYFIIISILVIIILIEPFIGIRMGSKVILSDSQYEKMKNISDKYGYQEKVLEELESKFLYKTDPNKLKEGSIRGMVYGFDDPYTVYMSKDEFSNFLSNMQNSFVGIGIIVETSKNSLNISDILPNSPAKEVGLKINDKIIKINDEAVILDTISLETITNKIRGPENTKVKLTISREEEIMDFTITRKKTEKPNLYSKQINDIGYIKLLNFDPNSASLFKSTLYELMENKTKKLIIDLRDNPGGLLDEAINISNLFLPPKTLIAYTKDNKNKKTKILTSKTTDPISLPTVIIVNNSSASASELFAGMMQDYKLATIIGAKTYGKGVMQSISTFKDGSAIRLTIAEYFTPNDKKINKIGVIPDIDLSKKMSSQKIYINSSLENLEEDVCFKKSLEILNKN